MPLAPQTWLAALYRLQQRLALTQRESLALLTLAALLLSGLVIRYHFEQPVPLPDEAKNDALFPETPAPAIAPAFSADTSHEGRAAAGAAPIPLGRDQAVAGVVPRINLNTATASALQQLPRIGPKLADRIIAYRTDHGPFHRVRDLVRVRGIGDRTFAQLEPYLFVEDK